MKIVNTIKNKLTLVRNKFVAFVNTIKYYFYYTPKRFVLVKYYRVYELLTYKLLSITTNMTKTLIIRMGKDPNYVPPPVVVQQEPVINDLAASFLQKKTLNIPFVPSWVRSSFKSIGQHPVYKSRVDLNLRPDMTPVPSNPEPLQVAQAPLEAEPALEVLVNPEAATTDISVDDTGTITYGFIKFGDADES